MTIEPRIPTVRLSVAGRGPYAFAFPVFAEEDLRATVELAGVVVGLDLGSDFTVTLAAAGPRAGGSIRLSTAIAAAYAGAKLTIDRAVSREQGWEAVTRGRETGIEAQLDLTVMGLQDAWREIGRSLRFLQSVEPVGLPGADRPIVGDGRGGLKIGPNLAGLDALRAAAARLDAWIAAGGGFGGGTGGLDRLDGIIVLIEHLRLEIEATEVHATATINTRIEGIVDSTQSLASRVDLVEATYTAGGGGGGDADFTEVLAFIRDEATARATAISAEAEARRLVSAQVDQNKGAVETIQKALATSSTALAELSQRLTASLKDANSQIDTLARAQVTDRKAVASLTSSLQASVRDASATLQVIQSVSASLEAVDGAVGVLEARSKVGYIIRAKAGAASGTVEVAAASRGASGAASLVRFAADTIRMESPMTVFGGSLKSANHSTGKTGWRIYDDGRADFNGVVLSRDLIVDSGSFDPPGSIIANNGVFDVESEIRIASWGGPKTSYIATAETSNWSVRADNGDISANDVYWGVTAEIVPFTRWNGGSTSRLYVRLRVQTKNVIQISGAGSSAARINWKIYKVT